MSNIFIFIVNFSLTNLIRMGQGTGEVEKLGNHFKFYQDMSTGTSLLMR